MASRYPPRYDNDARRSRSRDRSPDRRSLYSDGGPRRSSAESRGNGPPFNQNRGEVRELFREPREPLPRDTPRGPKALIGDPPNGPRGGGFGGEFRGRGGRGGRGRGWRDESRDRGRDRDGDFRDRRDGPPFRDERSRERERPDWRDRDRDFRGRRPPSPRGRSPVGRDFRDGPDRREPRDPPLGVDADRARRGSRDGPLSAGSSSSDQPFGQPYRGGFGGRGRGGRGRGDREWGRGRPFYDDRDRFGPNGRPRSQEGRFRDRDDRDRDREPRFFDPDNRPRDPRDARGPHDPRDLRDDRDVRPKLDRTSHEPPAVTKDVSPPPVAPAAPSFGSVPNRSASTSEAVGKAPPTGPRALKEERPVAPGVLDAKQPPTGPSKPAFPDGSPPIPSGPRGLRPPGPSSKQWVNPTFKPRPSDITQQSRSNSFAQPRAPGRPSTAGSDHPGDHDQRPRSSDGKVVSRRSSTLEPGEHPASPRRRSAGSPFDHGSAFKQHVDNAEDDDTKMVDAPHPPPARELSPGEIDPEHPGDDETPQKPIPKTKPVLRVPRVHVSLPRKQAKLLLPEPSESSDDDDDDENFGEELDKDMASVEEKLKKLEGLEDALSMQPVVRHAIFSIEAIIKALDESPSMQELVGRLPESVPAIKEKPESITKAVGAAVPAASEEDKEMKDAEPTDQPVPATAIPSSEKPLQNGELAGKIATKDMQPEIKKLAEDEDTVMEDATENARPAPPIIPVPIEDNGLLRVPKRALIPSTEVESPSQVPSKHGSTTPSPPEDEDEETDIEDIDLQSIQIVRQHGETPPLDILPDFNETPWMEDKLFMKSLNASNSALDDFIMKRLKDDTARKFVTQTEQREAYGENYESYLRFTLSDDQDAVKSRGRFTCVASVPDPVPVKPVTTAEPKTESTRRSRYASERDLERVLEESRRVEDEKRERQIRAEKEKYRTEKEAVIPLQYQTEKDRENEFYVDMTGFLEPEKIVTAWEVLPPTVNFTEDETAAFEKAYLEFPKQWGRISERTDERKFGTNIQFYYLMKDELNLKDKLKRRPRQRKRGRGKQRSSALVSELGNRENEGDENAETGENGERRRPRRAAAPTFNSEATPATDEGITPAGTPGRRVGASRGEGAGDKPERKRGRRAAKDKEPKQPRSNQTLAAAPTSTKGNRSRSSSRVQNTDWMQQQPQPDLGRGISTFEIAQPGPPPMPQVAIPPPPTQIRPPIMPTELSVPQIQPPVGVFDAMAPPLRPEPPQQQQPPVTTLDLGQSPAGDRKPVVQASSYWSVPEANDFPLLLNSFGTDWAAIANHMKTKTAVMVKNYYARQKGNNKNWEVIAAEADAKKARGESRPIPPPPSTTGPKKRTEAPGNRPLAAADAIMDDAPLTKIETPSAQSMTGRFNVPIAAQPPQPPSQQPTFVSAPHGPQPVVAAPAGLPAGALGHGQPVSQTMSPRDRPLRQPYTFEREREGDLVQPGRRTPLGQKPSSHHGPPIQESMSRHPLPPSVMDSPMERQRMESKMPKEQPRQPLRVKQEPDIMSHAEPFPGQAGRMPLSSRGEPLSLGRQPEAPRAVAPAPQAPYAVLQQQPSRGALLGETMAPTSQPPRPVSELSRPMSGASGGSDSYGTPPRHAPSSATPAPSRAPEPRKTSSLMALLNDDPPPPPKRVSEVPAAARPSPTPPPQSRPPPPAPPSQLRRGESIVEPQYYSRNPPAAPSSMPSLKPYTSSPQSQPLAAPRHMAPMDQAAERDYYAGRQGPYAGGHQPPPAGSPSVGYGYQAPGQPPHGQSPYGYGGPGQQPPAASPQGQYAGLSQDPRDPRDPRDHRDPRLDPRDPRGDPRDPRDVRDPRDPRGHEGPSHSREHSWSGHSRTHSLQQQQQQQQQQPPQHQHHPSWSQQQPPKSGQPQPTQSAWAAQHAAAGAPKPPPQSSSMPPQQSWANTPPRGPNPMALRGEVYPPSRGMQPPGQSPYPPSSRAPEPAPPQPPNYPRYSNTPGPGPGRDPRELPPQRSYTPTAYESRAYPPPGQEMRDAQIREQQAREQHHHQAQQQAAQQQQQHQQHMQQQLRPQDGRQFYDQREGPYNRR